MLLLLLLLVMVVVLLLLLLLLLLVRMMLLAEVLLLDVRTLADGRVATEREHVGVGGGRRGADDAVGTH